MHIGHIRHDYHAELIQVIKINHSRRHLYYREQTACSGNDVVMSRSESISVDLSRSQSILVNHCKFKLIAICTTIE